MATDSWWNPGHYSRIRSLQALKPPYFHSGSALEDVIDFYEARFRLGLTAQERSDLIAFLRAL